MLFCFAFYLYAVKERFRPTFLRFTRIFSCKNGHTKHMIKPTKNIKDIKQMVKDCSAQRVAVRVNLGRNKSMSYSGILSGIYPALFTVKPDEEGFLGKTAYSYSDVLCGNVKIKRL